MPQIEETNYQNVSQIQRARDASDRKEKLEATDTSSRKYKLLKCKNFRDDHNRREKLPKRWIHKNENASSRAKKI